MISFGKTNNKYGCFSNFYKCKILYEGIYYNSSEAAWQAQKTINYDDRVQFANLSASEAKKLGRKVNLRPDWEDIKYALMVNVCYEKFRQNNNLLKTLLETGDEYLEENTTGWHDNIWGNCKCPKCINKVGNNLLGKALMEVRAMLRNQVAGI